MRKKLLSVLLACLVTAVASAAVEDSYVLHEGFESGSMPAGWTQDNGVAYQQPWAVESGTDAAYPTGAFAGNYRIALRNTTTQTQHFVTKLITPAMDLREVFQPILVFSHAQLQRTGDVDTLRIYYRTSGKGNWVELATFANKTNGWKTDTVQLSGTGTSTYQLAFEGIDNFGRGIVLDEVIVRPQPTCSEPNSLLFSGLTTSAFTLRWNGSLDTDSFEILLNGSKLDPNSVDEDNLMLRKFIDPTQGMEFSTGDVLARNKKYYVYLRAYCSSDRSSWVEDSVTTKNIVNIPYSNNFDMGYMANTITFVNYWTRGSNILDGNGNTRTSMPFINTNEEVRGTARAQKAFNRTSCLCFTGANSTTTEIPAGFYVYGATPELNVESVSDLEVSFWGTSYNKYGEGYASGLIVGVMTDPANFETFVPVDTVYATGLSMFAEYHVLLDKYTGTGKYIAFVSNFEDKKNIFYLDDLVIQKRPTMLKPEVTFGKTLANSVEIIPDLKGAKTWNLVITEKIKGEDWDATPNTKHIIYTQEGITSPTLTVTADTLTDKVIVAFVQTVDGSNTSEWSLPQSHIMPNYIKTYPYNISFKKAKSKHTLLEIAGRYHYGSVSSSAPEGILAKYDVNKYILPYLGEAGSTGGVYGYDDGYGLMWSIYASTKEELKKKTVYGAFPMVDDVTKVLLSFYAAGGSATGSYPEDIGKFVIGVLDDPYDFSTFYAIDTIQPVLGRFNKYQVSFANYKGTGKFVAYHALISPTALSEPEENLKTYALGHVDCVTFEIAGECSMAAPQPITTDTTVTLNWLPNSAGKWNVQMYRDGAESKVRDGVFKYVVDSNSLFINQTVTSPTITIKGLQPHTDYYYTVTTPCTTPLTTDVLLVHTDCALNGEPLPYSEDFEGYQGVGSQVKKIANCWTTDFIAYNSGGSYSSTSFYPFIRKSTVAGATNHSGVSHLEFGSPSTYNSKEVYVALPRFAIDAVNKLQISAWIQCRNASYQDTILVGVMIDPTDINTFETVTEFVVKGSGYVEYVASLAKYQGKGEYIALKKTTSSRADAHIYYLDDVKVRLQSTCGTKVQGIEATRLDDGVAFAWIAQDVAGYDVLITKSEITDMDNIPASEIQYQHAVKGRVDTISNKAANFASNTQYYVYVRTSCSETNKGDWSNGVAFKTSCIAETPESFGIETFEDANRFACWTPGLNILQSAGGNPSMTAKVNNDYYLYLYDVKFTAKTGKEKGGQSYVIMPALDVDSISHVEISFQGHAAKSDIGILDIGVCVDNFTDYQMVDSLRLGNVFSVAADDNYGFNEALTYTIRFKDYVGDAEGRFGKKIVLLSRGNKDANNKVHLKNVTIRTIGKLAEPIQVEIPEDSIRVGVATVMWDAQQGATGYEVKYATAAIDPDTDQPLSTDATAVVKTVTTNKPSVQLTGLDNVTWYYVYVRSTNGNERSIWSNMRKFKSSCPESYALPYSINFDDYKSDATIYPECWTRYYDKKEGYYAQHPYIYNNAKRGTKGNGLYVGSKKSAKSYIATPYFEIDSLSKAMITFYYKASSKSSTSKIGMSVGIAEDISCVDSIEKTYTPLWTIKEYTNNTDFKRAEVIFDKYKGNGHYIVFRGETQATSVYGIYLDDIVIERIPSCYAPAEITQTSARTTSIQMNILDEHDGSAWEVAIVPMGGKVEDAAPVKVASADALANGDFVINGLKHSTKYDVYARTVCSESDKSKWAGPVQMSTLTLLPLSKANWDFEYSDDERKNYLVVAPKATSESYLTEPMFIEDNLNASATYTYYPYLMPTNIPDATDDWYGYKSYFAMKLQSNTSNPTSYFALPEIDASLDTLQLRFDATSVYLDNATTKALSTTYAKGTNCAHSVKVGVMSDPYDWSTFNELQEFIFPEITVSNDTLIGDSMGYYNHYTLNLFGAELKGKYIAFATDYDKVQNYAYIDNIVVEPQMGCGAPSGLSVVDSTLLATSTDIVWVSNKLKWNVQLYENDTILALDSTISAAKIAYETRMHINNLVPNTTYLLRVRNICSEEESGGWTEIHFATPCADRPQEEAVWNFEDDLYQYGANAKYLIPNCWKVGGRKITIASGATDVITQAQTPYVLANETNKLYAQGSVETTARAMYFTTPNSSTVRYEAYAIMPRIEGSLKGMQLHLYGRATDAARNTKKMTANSKYDRKLYLGIMPNEDDINTIQILDSIVYNKIVTTSDLYTDDENEFWQEYLISLDKFDGHKVVFYATSETKATSKFYIDNLEVLPAGYCFRPSRDVVSDIKSTTAKLAWNSGGNAVNVQIATNEDFTTNAIIQDVVVEKDKSELQLTNLPSATTLYYRLRSACGEGNYSEWGAVGSFMTMGGVPFTEDFRAAVTYPTGWSRYSKRMIDVCDTTAGAIGNEIGLTAANAWKRSPVSVGMNSGHMIVNVYQYGTGSSAGMNPWLVTPQIDLTSVAEGTKLALSFNLSMTEGANHTGAEPDRVTGVDDALVVAISEDNKATWKSEDLTVWANQPFPVHVTPDGDTIYVEPQYEYNQISSKFGGEVIFIDLSKFAGKIINIGFYAETTLKNADNDIHMDNVLVSTYTPNIYDQEVCRWEDFSDANFSIDVDDYAVGKTMSYISFRPSKEGSSLNQLNLTVKEDAHVVIDTTICEGTTYDANNFNVVATKSTVIKQKVSGSNSCDSVAELRLNVTPKVYADTAVSICYGKYVDFCGEQYYTSGNYTCTTTSAITGCDSVVTLHLTVQEMAKGDAETVYLCPGATITFGDTTLATEGTYERIITINGCDSLAKMNVYQVPNEETQIRALICKNETYNKDPFRGMSNAGDYRLPLQSQYGCDSIIALHLMVADAEHMALVDSITLDELPYILNDVELLPAGTTEGTYTREVNLSCGAVTLTIVVGEPTGLHSVFASSLAIAPNPVAVGQAIRVLGSFAADAVVEVVSPTGARIYRAENVPSPVTIPGIPVSGTYLVTVTSNGQVFQSKLIVR